MFGFLDNLCSCFSPQIKQNILEYLSSSTLNRQVIQQEKCSQQLSQSQPGQSIYTQAKMKSYYFMKIKEEQSSDNYNNPQKSVPSIISDDSYDLSLEPNYYPISNSDTQQDSIKDTDYDQIYTKKLNTLKKILQQQIGIQYSKIYDSQDELNLRIYCKPEIYGLKRFNSYRFQFDIKQKNVKGQDFLKTDIHNNQPLLKSIKCIQKTKNGLEIYRRCYDKILVIGEHQFYTAEKGQMIDQDLYYTVFSVKGSWDSKEGYKQGWINLSGLKLSNRQQQEQQGGTSLREDETYLQVSGYINVELQISVNANMLKQPIAKQIRIYVQKLVCSMTQSDAI